MIQPIPQLDDPRCAPMVKLSRLPLPKGDKEDRDFRRLIRRIDIGEQVRQK